MKRPKRRQAGADVDGQTRRRTTQAARKPREGQCRVEDKKTGQGGEPPPKWFTELYRIRREVLDNNPLHDELEHQKIRLRDNGFEMEWGLAQNAVEMLRDLQADNAEAFGALVALAKPRGAKRLPDKVSPKALAALKKEEHKYEGDRFLDTAGLVVKPDFVLVLDAAYMETEKEGVVLRDPVDYLSREWVEKWAPIDRKLKSELARLDRLAAEEAKEERRKMRGKDDGPSL